MALFALPPDALVGVGEHVGRLQVAVALPENEMMAACHLELKDALYRAVSPCRTDFLEALMHFGHPNIVSAEVVPFCKCIEELLRTARDNDESEPAAQFSRKRCVK